MIHPDEVADLIKRAIPDAQVQAEDMRGTGDHFHVLVVSSVFKGKLLIEQHRLVQEALRDAFQDGRIHAVQIKTQTPEEWMKKSSGKDDLHVVE